jgi:hypothetical protein
MIEENTLNTIYKYNLENISIDELDKIFGDIPS